MDCVLRLDWDVEGGMSASVRIALSRDLHQIRFAVVVQTLGQRMKEIGMKW